MNHQEKKDLFRVRRTVLEMLTDRGYRIPESLSSVTFEQFSIQYEQRNINLYIEDPEKEKKYYVHFHTNPAFGKNDLKSVFANIMETYQDETMGIIILLKEKENTSIMNEKAKPLYRNVEFFEQKKMTFNITKHVFVPKHIILTAEEEAEVLEKYQTPKSKFPVLRVDDAQAKYYGMVPNQMCKIIRQDPEVGLSISYRVVR